MRGGCVLQRCVPGCVLCTPEVCPRVCPVYSRGVSPGVSCVLQRCVPGCVLCAPEVYPRVCSVCSRGVSPGVSCVLQRCVPGCVLCAPEVCPRVCPVCSRGVSLYRMLSVPSEGVKVFPNNTIEKVSMTEEGRVCATTKDGQEVAYIH